MNYDYIDRYYSSLACLPVNNMGIAKFYHTVTTSPLITTIGIWEGGGQSDNPAFLTNIPFIPNASAPYIIPHSKRNV